MKWLTFGVLAVSLGLALSPRSTVAGKDESLAVLCERWGRLAKPIMDAQWAAVDRIGRARWTSASSGEISRNMAVATSLQAVGSVFCSR